MFDNRISWRYATDNGFAIFDDVSAVLGFNSEQGRVFSIAIDGTCLKDFTLDSEGVTGEECDNTDGTWGRTFKCNLAKTSSGPTGEPAMINFEIPSDNPNLRLAMVLSRNERNMESFISWTIHAYNTQTHDYSDGYPWTFDNLDADSQMYKISIPYSPPPGYVQNYNATMDNILFNYNKVGDYGFPFATYFEYTRLSTNIPVFDTLEHARAYLADETNETIDGILNYSELDPEEEYSEQFKYHYVNNIFGHNTRNASSYTGYRNYRFFPKSKPMCFYRVKPTASNPYTVKLKGYDSSVVVKSAPAYGSSDDDYETITAAPELFYLHKSISFSDNDYYTKFKFSTDLLVYGNESDAQDYIDGVGDPRLAENFNDVSRQYNEFVDPGYGNPDTGNDHGKNGINYSRGSTLWKLTETEMHTFFGDIFDTGNISDILSNTQLFGANQINSILGVAYYPFDVADVCRLDTSKKIYVGSWECPNATGKRVLFNYDLLDCGSISIPRVYNDYRDYEMEIYISLPYVGVHKLNTALYMGASSLHIYYAVDVSTGCCTAHLHVTNETLTDCEIDSWDGFISSMRPISAVDQQAYISGVMGNVTSIFNRETGMINDAAQAVGGVMSGNVKGALSSGVGPGYGFSQSAGAIGDLYGLSQSVRDVPISTRGGFSGALGMFGNQKIHIITAQKRKTVPDNKLLTVGLPSNIGGRVGLFSGFLSVSAFTMADGFTGTAEELREIESIMASGIFL